MSCGLRPNITNPATSTTSPPKQPLNPRNLQNHPFTFSSRTKKWPSLHCCCSSFKTPRAAMEEGGVSIGEKANGSFYDLLGISEEGSFDEIKRAYKQLARKYHPDVSPPERAEECTRRFIQVHEAYQTLSDPGRRAIYDRDLLAGGFHLAFSARRKFHQDLDERTQWKNRWQYQVEALKKKSAYNDSAEENLSWGARMRRQRAES